MPSDRHQHQTPERTAAEARVIKAASTFDAQWEAFLTTIADFHLNAGNTGELATFERHERTFWRACEELHNSRRDLNALDRSIP